MQNLVFIRQVGSKDFSHIKLVHIGLIYVHSQPHFIYTTTLSYISMLHIIVDKSFFCPKIIN